MSLLPLVLVGLGALLLSREGGPSSPPPGPTPGPSPNPSPGPSPSGPSFPGMSASRYRVIGDSLGVGLAPPLRKLLGSVEGAAIGGTRIDSWVELGKRKNIGGNARVVLVSLGTNDIASGVTAAAVHELVPRLVHQVRMGNSRIGWIGPPTLPQEGAAFRAALALELQAAKVPLFDSAAITFERSPDRVHATSAGYATWAAAVAAWLPQVGLT